MAPAPLSTFQSTSSARATDMSEIVDFLQGKTLLITGSTGFLAKGMVEKILRVAPDVERIYLLIRGKGQANGGAEQTAQYRLEREVLGSSVFTRLREVHGAGFDAFALERLVAVDGDLTRERLGLSPEDYERVTREVQVVINSAATVVFDEQLDEAISLNTLGPRRLLEVARACAQKPLFVHVSTAYVSGQQRRPFAEEPLPVDRTVAQLMGRGEQEAFDPETAIQEMLAVCEEFHEASRQPERLEVFERMASRRTGNGQSRGRQETQAENLRLRWLRSRLVREGMRRARRMGWHDSYTLTKALGEQLIVRDRGDLTTVIVRPSIIESSLSEPEPGWLDGLKVADGIIAPFSKGRLPDFPGNPKTIIDLIPVDFVINATLAALPRAAAAGGVQVYHVASGLQNPLQLRQLVDLCYDYFKRIPMRGRQGEPIRTRRWTYPSPWLFRRWVFFRYQFPLGRLQWLLARFPGLPGANRLKRRVTLLRAIYDRAVYYSRIYSTYTRFNFEFRTDNTTELYRSLSPDDQKAFDFDVEHIRWEEYIQEVHIPGLKRHVLLTGGGGAGDRAPRQVPVGTVSSASAPEEAVPGEAAPSEAAPSENVPTGGG